MRKTFTFDVDVGMANAIRRALISDLPHIAPDDVVIHANTTYHTDEYVAHRIAMLPFCRTSTASSPVASIVVADRDVLARDVECTGVRVVGDDDDCVLRVAPGQHVDLDVTFRVDTGATHARFSRTVAVGMRSLDVKRHEIGFETLVDDDHEACLRDALVSLRRRIQNARDRL